MLDAFETSILEFSLSLGLLPVGGNVLIAVSGGADSVALLHAFKRLKDEGKVNCDFFVGHINHNLRGIDSDGDEAFVKGFAEELGFRCLTRSVDVKGYAAENKLSIETAARDLRIESLIEMAKLLDCERIATAHHADDNAETVIYRLARGTGFKGLCGISPKNIFIMNGNSATFIRPLLSVTKEEIIAYCQGNGIQWRHDHTNDEFDYARNRIRHLVIPYLQKQRSERFAKGGGHGPPYGIEKTDVGRMPTSRCLTELSAGCRKLFERIENKIEAYKDGLFNQTAGGGISISSEIMKKVSPVVAAEIIRRAFVKVGCGQRYVTRKHYQKIVSLLDGQGGKIIELPGGFNAKLEHGKIVFYPPADSVDTVATDDEKVEIKIPGTVKFGVFEIKAKILKASDCDLEKFKAEKNNNVEWFDMDKAAGSIYARRRKEGDKFIPIGMNSEKKVGKFLTAGQVDYRLRENIIIFEDKKRVVWVGPVRGSEETKVTKSTIGVLQIEIVS